MSTPENTGRLSVNCDGFWMTKKPLPLIATKVEIDAA